MIALLGLREGDRVADLGAGGGYFSFRLARAVGPSGRVWAVDVDEGLLDHVARRAEEQGLANLEPLHARPDDPGLPDASVDLVFVSNTYHHLPERVAYFRRLLDDLAPNGRVAIVELDGRGSGLARLFGHFTSADAIEREMAEAGYERLARHELLERQSFQVFRADDGTGE